MKVLHTICQQIWKTQQWPQDWKRSVFIPICKKGNAKECSNYHTIALISHTSKLMLKNLQARLQQYMNSFQMFNLVLEKAGKPEIKLPSSTATAAKSLQSCPTLCDPIDGSPPGSPVPGILQASTLEWVAISFSSQHPLDHRKSKRVPEKHLFLLY